MHTLFIRSLFFLFFLPFVQVKAVPPERIPTEYYHEYTLNGAIPVVYWYWNQESTHPLTYTREWIDGFIERIQRREEGGYVITDTWIYQAIEKYLPYIKGKTVAIIGSTGPWYEAVVIAYEGHPVTIEYNKIISTDPRLIAMTPAEYEASPQLFDAIISISSIEHDGLGRYGDPINPWGDFQAIQSHKRMLKKDGLMFLSIPVGKDELVWNAHRVYGRIRLPLLLQEWKVIDTFGYTDSLLDRGGHIQPVFVLRPRQH